MGRATPQTPAQRRQIKRTGQNHSPLSVFTSERVYSAQSCRSGRLGEALNPAPDLVIGVQYPARRPAAVHMRMMAQIACPVAAMARRIDNVDMSFCTESNRERERRRMLWGGEPRTQ